VCREFLVRRDDPGFLGTPVLNAVDLRICVLFCLFIPAKAGFVKVMKKLDSRLRGNDVKVLLRLT